MVKQGDIVRYLNAVGGGKVIRVKDNIAIVDDDGFETPVAIRECVVVRTAEQEAAAQPKPRANTAAVAPKTSSSAQQPTKIATPSPVVAPLTGNNILSVDDLDDSDDDETPNGNKLNVVLGFEAINLKEISKTDYEASLVNDSNYYLYFTLLTANNDTPEVWTTRYAGMVEPNIQVLIGTFTSQDVSKFDRIAIQYIAFKRRAGFEPKAPASVSYKVDTTKFFKLHCFRQNMYFDSPVLAFPVVQDDKPCNTPQPLIDSNVLETELKRKKNIDRKPVRRKVIRHADDPTQPLVVDLHITELVDSTRGLSNADMLNLQVDKFREVMRANLRNVGRKLIFIHGKGEGVLRQALMKELNHLFKGHDVQDASFREYGYGATQVTIRNVRR